MENSQHIASAQPDNLIKMANEIAAYNLHHGDIEDAATLVASHMKKFWARPMKKKIISYLQEDGSALSDTARRATELLAQSA